MRSRRETLDETELELLQYNLEEEALALGMEHYYKTLEYHQDRGSEDCTSPVQHIIRQLVGDVAQSMETKVNTRTRGRAMGGMLEVAALDLGWHDVAYVTLRLALTSVSKVSSLTSVAVAIGTDLCQEAALRKFQEEHPQYYKQITETRHGRDFTTNSHLIVSVNKLVDYLGIQGCHIKLPGTRQRLQMGMWCLDHLLGNTAWFRTFTSQESKKQKRVYFAATQDLIDWLSESHEALAILAPRRFPMVVPPLEWTGPLGGGYKYNLGPVVPIVKSRNDQYIMGLEATDMPLVYRTINTLQAVPWQINAPVLDVAKVLWSQDREVGKSMPPRVPLDPPPWNDKYKTPNEWKEADWEGYKHWAQEAASIHETNSKNVSKRVVCGSCLAIGDKLVAREKIYFPYQMDFRGRVYPVPAHLHPQAADLGRALLRFSKGHRLGQRGLYWLKVHTANLFGVDKVSFDDRVAWVDEHWESLVDSGMDPLEGEQFWLTADKPFGALAACIEIAGVAIEGEDYESHLPIAMDGSNNGLQNFSALMRDPTGGKSTNLVPQDAPADVYQDVADIVERRVREDAEGGHEFAVYFDGIINRTLVKQPCMTLAYGATKRGMAKQMDKVITDVGNPTKIPRRIRWRAAMYLAEVTHDAISQVVVAAVNAMDWLQDLARVATSQKLPIRWTSPTGLPVLMEYRRRQGERVVVHLSGRRVQLVLSKDTTINGRKMTQSVAPNYVHSLDSSHMSLTVSYLLENGIEDMSMIHDSFATHACHVDTLNAALREAFIDIYSADRFQMLYEEIKDQVPEDLHDDLPPPPESLGLDIEVVRSSPYFFA